MIAKMLDRLLKSAAAGLVVLAIAACTIHLRGEDNQAPSVISMDQAADQLPAKLQQCRSVTSEQKEALAECRKVWAEKRRQFLGQTSQRHQIVSLLPGARRCSSLTRKRASHGSGRLVTV